jgi:hypothetical protein
MWFPAFCVAAILAGDAKAEKDPYQWAAVRLDYARAQKVAQLEHFCARVHGLARRASEDPVFVKFFDVNLKCFHLTREGTPPAALRQKTTEFRKAFSEYYIENWLAFYDILFVDRRGDVFYTLRRDSNFEQNLFEGELANTPLARTLRENPQEEVFVDFHHCDISGEPAAFFVEPVRKDGELMGWIVLQCAINKVNSLFSGTEELGQTGETFLINHEGYMLTESSFEGDSTILKKKLSQDNIEAKFRDKQGHRTVTDYRGFTALTSFALVEFLGTQWLVVAKVDASQITTEHFTRHREYYRDRIVQHLKDLPPGDSRPPLEPGDQRVVRVDMDEFVKADHGELLKTVGVATCTAVVATYPGKFGYLAHISPLDKTYGMDGTNLLGHVTKKIKTYDVYNYERRRVRFVVVAPHFDSLARIVDKLVDEGFLLSQISVLYHPGARCANVAYDYSRDRIAVEWILDGTPERRCLHNGDDGHNLETVVQNSMSE